MTKLFVYTEKSRTISRTYGGSTYTLNVWEIVKNKPVLLGTVTACTRGHMGEDSEAWSVVRKERPNIIKSLVREIEKKEGKGSFYAKEAKGNYYTWKFRDFGVQLQKL